MPECLVKGEKNLSSAKITSERKESKDSLRRGRRKWEITK
jgi:hypothetical protein